MLKGRLGLESARIPHTDRHGLLYLGRGNLYVEQGTLRFRTGGFDGAEPGDYQIPFQTISSLLLGPGTTVSHDALRLLARHGTSLYAVAEGSVRLYASLPSGPDQSARARRQAQLWAEPRARLQIARRMYAWRLGDFLPNSEIAVLRGIEGARAKETYRRLADQFGVSWHGRRYDRSRPEQDDSPNQAINHASTATLAAAELAVAATGAIPQLGFIHEDSGLSFPLDIADLYRDSVTVPVAFASVREHAKKPDEPLERIVRRNAGRAFRDQGLVSGMIDRIKEILDANDGGGDQRSP